MKKNKKILSKQDVTIHKDAALNTLNTYLESLIEEENTLKKADLLSYWLEDYTKYLSSEDTFKPSLYKKYERGDIIKVNLGFNIGSEEGGLHYAVVVDRKNAINSPTITVIPLSSIKEGTTLHYTDVNLGPQIYDKLKEKIDLYMQNLVKPITCKEDLENMNETQVSEMILGLQEIDKMVRELSRMKSGSFAIVNQITTISKQRIYDPKHVKDILSGIKLSNENLDLINEKLKKLYIW